TIWDHQGWVSKLRVGVLHDGCGGFVGYIRDRFSNCTEENNKSPTVIKQQRGSVEDPLLT
nr:hypothetical protein [Dehalococcoidia bacterium]